MLVGMRGYAGYFIVSPDKNDNFFIGDGAYAKSTIFTRYQGAFAEFSTMDLSFLLRANEPVYWVFGGGGTSVVSAFIDDVVPAEIP
jgi:hypothetical protein